MIAIIRLAIFGALGLTILYWLVATYSRSVQRENLEKHWDANPPEGQGDTERSAYIEAGMQDYEHGLRKKLIWLVIVIPMIIFGLTVYWINF